MKNITLIWAVIGLIIGLINPMNNGPTVINKIAFAIPWALVFGGIALVIDFVTNWFKRKNNDNPS